MSRYVRGRRDGGTESEDCLSVAVQEGGKKMICEQAARRTLSFGWALESVHLSQATHGPSHHLSPPPSPPLCLPTPHN